MRTKAIIFDLDGTLLNTLEDIANAANYVLALKGFPAHPLESYRYAVGNGVRILMERVLPENVRTAEMIDSCFAPFYEEYEKHWNVKTTPYPGIPEMLDAVQSRGMKFAVLSNKPAPFTRKCVAEFLSRWKFDVVIGAEEGFAKKPDTAGALHIIKQLNVQPEECLYLGDSGVDMQTARAAGMFAVGALWGFRECEELLHDGAQKLIEEPIELLNILDIL